MIKVEEVDDVLAIKCGSEVNGRVLYWTTLYYYKNLVIDTGCLHTAHELKDFFHSKAVKAILITHYHGRSLRRSSYFQTTCFHPETIT